MVLGQKLQGAAGTGGYAGQVKTPQIWVMVTRLTDRVNYIRTQSVSLMLSS